MPKVCSPIENKMDDFLKNLINRLGKDIKLYRDTGIKTIITGHGDVLLPLMSRFSQKCAKEPLV